MGAKPIRTWPMFVGGSRGVMTYLVLLVISLILGPWHHGVGVNAQGTGAGAVFLNQKESDVKAIAENASLNNDNCGSLQRCSGGCSRVVCHPLSKESPQCTTVDYNEFYSECPRGACQNKMLVDYTRSFVTLPAPGSTNLSTEVARDICLQRELDSTFKTVSLPSEYSNVYFGSSSGAFRSFPGRERNGTGCNTYDPRKRPWYLNGVSVTKEVKILVDVASSMGNLVSVDYGRLPGTTFLDVAKNITLALLQAFSPEDYVEVFSFDSSSATSSAGAVQIVTPYYYLDPASLSELAPLGASVGNLTVSTKAAPSNLNRAIVQAVNSFNTTDKLKVIVVLSDGHFDPLNTTAFPSLKLQNRHIKLMVYKLPKSDDGEDPYLLNDPSLRENICSVNGSFERLNALETVNPLYSMRSYFTFLARTKLASVDDNAIWSIQYGGFSQDRTAATVTYPAFGSDGLLIGVAGLDVVIDDLNQPLQAMVYAEIFGRASGTQGPKNIPMVCNYQSIPASFICSGSTPANSSAICLGTNDPASTLASRTCCGFDTCGLAEAQPSKTKFLKILTFLLISVALLAAIAGSLYFMCKSEHEIAREVPESPVSGLLHFKLCEHFVRTIEDAVNNEHLNLLNRRQCVDLSFKLSETAPNIKQMVHHSVALYERFLPALEKLYLVLETAKLLVEECGNNDWYRASVFQSQNEIAFKEILLDLGLCYNVIYEQARSISEEGVLPEDLRKRPESLFMPAPQNAILEDQADLLTRLDAALANDHEVSAEQCLARYLLVKLNRTNEPSGAGMLNSILWRVETTLSEPWGTIRCILGAGGGANGVVSTEWLGIPCAKKEFHLQEFENHFSREARILAHLRHPCVVNFICCGDGDRMGHRFIATELMEKSLHTLIMENGHESIPLVVKIDIMAQIAHGMCYIHGQGIAHRDLKPQNVVVQTRTSPVLPKYFFVKLVDFGVSKPILHSVGEDIISYRGVGTTLYRAPEIFPLLEEDVENPQMAVWFKADVFSFAITCAHLLSLKTPFEGSKLTQLGQNMKNGMRPELAPSDCPKEIRELLENCWEPNPTSRPHFRAICLKLEAFRYKLFRGSMPTLEASEFIEEKVTYHCGTFSKRPFEDNTRRTSIAGTSVAGTSMGMTWRNAHGTSIR